MNKDFQPKKTIIVNLFAGPGAGKSTGAAYIFSRLKMLGYDCEYVSEFAKDKVWENNEEVFKCQFYITGKQVFKIKRCYGKVDIIITDSPIAIGAQYLKEDEKMLGLAILEEFDKYDNLNLFINRVKPYNTNGRNQTLEEAIYIDTNTKEWLTANNIEFKSINGDENGYDKAIELIKHMLKNKQCNYTENKEEIIYFEINDWFPGRDYPDDETFRKWIANRNFSDDKWCKKNKLCVLYGPIDMSENWCVSATKSWVEENCPQLLSDKSFNYVTITYKTNKETGERENTIEEFSKKYSEFLCKPDEYGDVYGRINYWLFQEYCEENFGCKYTNQWIEDNYDDEELDNN